MPDLFDTLPKPSSKPGTGNALFLADLANGASASTLRANHKAGKYPDLNANFAKANLAFWRMS